MFRIENGRSDFYQWDINQRLIILDDKIIEVHFTSAVTNPALVCVVYEENGVRLVNVPNILLQETWLIKAYGCCEECVRFETTYFVIPRDKPADYVYKETEVKDWNDLVARMDEIENKGVSDEKINSAVEAYLIDNPIEVDLTGYATEKYVDDAINGIDIKETDLSNYYTKAETNAAINNAQPDLTPYALKTDIPSTTGLATEKYVDDKFNSIDIPETDLSNYYTKAETNSEINKAKPDLTPYALKTDIPSIDGLATESYVDAKIAEAELSGGDVDLSAYATKEYVDNAIDDIEIPEAINGADGGYYTPSVNALGLLTWTASKSDMPTVAAANVKGEKGDKGEQGERGEKGEQGIKGDTGEPGAKGDAFTYDDFTAEQLAALKGDTGAAGKDGYTPIKGIDYFDGEKGEPGEKGDKGEPGEQGEPGAKGDTGAAGYTPVKGTDYYTTADKTEMKNSVIASLNNETWVFTLENGSIINKVVLIQ